MVRHWDRRGSLPIRLPGSGQVFGAQMNAVFFAVAEDIEHDTLPGAGIGGLAIRRKIDTDLNKTAIVFEADVTAHVYRSPASNDLTGHGAVGDATHHPVGEQLPAGADRGDWRLSAPLVGLVLRTGSKGPRQIVGPRRRHRSWPT
jgi:hypothetical protein